MHVWVSQAGYVFGVTTTRDTTARQSHADTPTTVHERVYTCTVHAGTGTSTYKHVQYKHTTYTVIHIFGQKHREKHDVTQINPCFTHPSLLPGGALWKGESVSLSDCSSASVR